MLMDLWKVQGGNRLTQGIHGSWGYIIMETGRRMYVGCSTELITDTRKSSDAAAVSVIVKQPLGRLKLAA